MASVTLSVGGRRYDLHCREGEQARLQELAAIVDAHAADAARMLGPTNEPRQLLMAALLLADELAEARATREPGDDPTEGLADALDTLAARVETLAERLEQEASAP